METQFKYIPSTNNSGTVLRDTHLFLSPTLFPPDNPKFSDGPKYVIFDQNF